MREFYTYVAADPITGEVHFVGRSRKPIEEVARCLIDRKGGDLGKWVEELRRAGRRPQVFWVALYDKRASALRSLVETGADLFNCRGVALARQASMTDRAEGPVTPSLREAWRQARFFIPRTPADLAASLAEPA